MPVHIQFSNEDILEGQQILQESRLLYFQALKSQEDFIKIRRKELKLKSSLKSKFRLLSSDLKLLHDSLPNINEKEIEDAKSNKSPATDYSLVEQDLRDIQSSLKRITKE